VRLELANFTMEPARRRLLQRSVGIFGSLKDFVSTPTRSRSAFIKYGPIGHLLGVTLLKVKIKSVNKTMLAAINERADIGESVRKKGRQPKQ
jgi:hypothetical protein